MSCRHILFLIPVFVFLLAEKIFSQGMGIGPSSFTPNSNAILELQGTGKGFLCPSWASTSRPGSPPTGLMYYQTDGSTGFYYYDGASWIQLTSNSSGNFILNQSSQQSSSQFNISGAGTVGGLFTGSLGMTVSGAVISLNASSNFATNINTGTSNGAVTIGGSAAQTIAIGNGVGGNTLNFANGINTSAQIINIGAGANGANNTINIGSGVNTAGVTAITIGSTAARANTLTIENGTGAITIGNSANARTWNVGAGNAIQTVNLFNNATPANIINLGGSASTTTISGILTINPSVNQATNINTGTSNGAVTIGGSAAQTISIGNGVGGNTLNFANGINTSAQTINIGAGANGANNSINIGSGVNTAGVTAITIGSTAARANTLTLENGTGAITIGNSANARTWNVGAGNAIQTVNFFNNATPANAINIGGAASTTTIGSIENTIGIAGTTGGNGVRIGNNRFTVNHATAPTVGLNANTTATVAQILDAGIIGFNTTLPRTLTLPSARGAAGLVQNLPGTPAVGDVFTFLVFNLGANNVTLVAGLGGTIVNTTPINAESRIIYCRVTSIAAGAETISVY